MQSKHIPTSTAHVKLTDDNRSEHREEFFRLTPKLKVVDGLGAHGSMDAIFAENSPTKISQRLKAF